MTYAQRLGPTVVKPRGQRTGFQRARVGLNARDRQFPVTCGVLLASNFLGVEWSLGNAVLRPSDFALGGIVAFLALGALARGRVRKVRLSHPALIALLAFLGFFVLNAFFSTSVSVGLVEAVQAVELVIVVLLVAQATRNHERRHVFLATFTISLGMIALYTAWYHVARGEFYNFKSLSQPKLTFGLVAALLVVRGRSSYEKLPHRVRHKVVLCVAILLMVLAGDRKGWIAFLIAVSATLFTRTARPRVGSGNQVRTALLLLGVGVFVAVAPLAASALPEDSYTTRQFRSLADLPAMISGQAGTTGSASNESRLFTLELAWSEFRSHPLVGVGPEQFRERSRQTGSLADMVAKNPHNEYVKVAVENGVIGLALYIWLNLTLLGTALRLASRMADYRSAPTILALCLYGLTINLFLAAGVINGILVVLPLGLLMGVAMDRPASEPDSSVPLSLDRRVRYGSRHWTRGRGHDPAAGHRKVLRQSPDSRLTRGY